MTRPRALQLCPNDHPPFQDVCRNHAAALAQLGMNVDTVFFGAPRGERWDAATYFGTERGTRRMSTSVREFVAGKDYRLVIAHRYRAHQVATRARSWLNGATFVTVAHEFGMFARWQRRLRRRLFASDVHYAGVSQAVADEMVRHGVPPGRTLTLPNPADVARFDAALLPRNTARERLGIATESYVVGVVGRLHPKKRPQLVLEGFAALDDGSHLAFIGDGELRGSLESLAPRLGIAARVHFPGRVPDASRYAAAFDAVVVASVPQEAFGMALLEAMLAGVPVVSADVPGPRSVLGPEGIYFAGDAAGLTAALRRCAALSVEQRARVSAMQRDRAVELFSLEATAARYRALLSTDEARLPGAS
jgi:glycosyltransferase involved in cell wall biosynthesis